MGRAPSLKRQKRQSGERQSLLSGEGGSGSEGEGGEEGASGLMEEDGTSLSRTDSMSQSERVPRHRRMESMETRSSMDLPPDALLQVFVELHYAVGLPHFELSLQLPSLSYDC